MSIFPYFYLSIYASISVPYISICLISNNNLRGDEVRIDKNILSKGKRVCHKSVTHPLFVFGGSYISTWTSCLPGEQGTMVPLMSLPSTVMRLTPFSLPSGFFITMWYSPPRNLRTTSYSLAVLGRQGSMRRPS